MGLQFEWDEGKASTNLKKHRVSFNEATTVFRDPLLWTFPDDAHSENEERYVSIGCSSKGRTLVVIHTDRDAVIRIISCRNATSYERRAYEERQFSSDQYRRR